MATCYKCNVAEVSEEFDYCSPCEAAHKQLASELDARPRVKEKKVKEELFGIKEVKQGIQVTTYISREDAKIMGIKLPN